MMNSRFLPNSPGRRLGAPLTAIFLAAAALTAAASATRTQTRIYRPFTSSGKPAFRVAKTISGDCWTGADAPARADAWKCETRADPCFSSDKAKGFVLCPWTGPRSSTVLKIRLTKPLPVRYGNTGQPSTSYEPWAIETTTGWKCLAFTGAGTRVGNQFSSYSCTNSKNWLWGRPSRKTEPWTIFYGPLSAKKLTHKASIAVAWF
jgi:hypothetical protein